MLHGKKELELGSDRRIIRTGTVPDIMRIFEDVAKNSKLEIRNDNNQSSGTAQISRRRFQFGSYIRFTIEGTSELPNGLIIRTSRGLILNDWWKVGLLAISSAILAEAIFLLALLIATYFIVQSNGGISDCSILGKQCDVYTLAISEILHPALHIFGLAAALTAIVWVVVRPYEKIEKIYRKFSNETKLQTDIIELDETHFSIKFDPYWALLLFFAPFSLLLFLETIPPIIVILYAGLAIFVTMIALRSLLKSKNLYLFQRGEIAARGTVFGVLACFPIIICLLIVFIGSQSTETLATFKLPLVLSTFGMSIMMNAYSIFGVVEMFKNSGSSLTGSRFLIPIDMPTVRDRRIFNISTTFMWISSFLFVYVSIAVLVFLITSSLTERDYGVFHDYRQGIIGLSSFFVEQSSSGLDLAITIMIFSPTELIMILLVVSSFINSSAIKNIFSNTSEKPSSDLSAKFDSLKLLVKGICRDLMINEPIIRLYPKMSLEALVLDREKKSKSPCIFFTEYALLKLSETELEAIACHELHHIKYDFPVLKKLKRYSAITLYGNAFLAAFHDFSQSEYQADAYAARIVGVDVVSNLLRKYSGLTNDSEQSGNLAHFGFFGPPNLDSTKVNWFLRTYQILFGNYIPAYIHPTIEERIHFLENYDTKN